MSTGLLSFPIPTLPEQLAAALALTGVSYSGVNLGAAILAPGGSPLSLLVPSGGALAMASNLSDLASASAARGNLGLGSMAVQACTAVALTGGTVDGAAIGTTTPAALQATTGLFSGPVSFAGAGTFTLPSWTATPANTAGLVGFNTTTGRFDFGIGIGVVNHVRLSGDTLTGALHMGTNTIDGSAVAFTGGTLTGVTHSGGTLSGTIAGNPNFSGIPTFNSNIIVNGSSTLNGATSVGSNTTTQTLLINGPLTSNRLLQFKTAGIPRWQMYTINATDDLFIRGYNDAGVANDILRFTHNYGAYLFTPPTITYSGSDNGVAGSTTNFSMIQTFSGSTTSPTGIGQNQWLINDTINDISQGTGFLFKQTVGPSQTGGRLGWSNQLAPVGPFTFSATPIFVGSRSSNVASGDGGGTASIQGANVSGFDIVSFLQPGSSNYGAVNGAQVNVYATGGNRLVSRSGIFIGAQSDNGMQGGRADCAFYFGMTPTSSGSSYPGAVWRTGYGVGTGGGSPFPLDPVNGSVMEALLAVNWSPMIPPAVTWRGVNFHNVNFTDSSIFFSGFRVLGDGTTRVGRLEVAEGVSGPSIDVPLLIASSTVTLVTAPVNFVAGDQLPDRLGGILRIDTVNGTGQATAAHYVRAPIIKFGEVRQVASANTVDAAALGATSLSLTPGTYGIAVGDTVVGQNIAVGTTVTSFTTNGAVATVGLNTPTAGILAINSQITFTLTMTPANPMHFINGSGNSSGGSAITANVTWVAATKLAIAPSGILTAFGGPVQLTPTTPASSAATGAAGQIAVDASFLYVCSTTNTWKRAALSTF